MSHGNFSSLQCWPWVHYLNLCLAGYISTLEYWMWFISLVGALFLLTSLFKRAMPLVTTIVSGVGHFTDILLNHEWLPYYQGATPCCQIFLQARIRTKHDCSILNVSVTCIFLSETFSTHPHQQCWKILGTTNHVSEFHWYLLTSYKPAKGFADNWPESSFTFSLMFLEV